MKKQVLTIGLGLMLSALATQAQVYRPGLLVQAPGDTLRGELEDDSWDEQPGQVRWRPGPGGAAVTYQGATLRAVKIDGGQYFRREQLPLDRGAQVNTDRLQEGLAIEQKQESVLAEVLVDGPGQLLYTAVGNVHHYFVRRPGQPFLELTERLYLKRQEGRLLITDGNNFRAELQRYFGDCPVAVAAAGQVPFTAAGLAALVQAYNQECDPTRRPGPAYLGKPIGRRVAVNLGVVAGGRYASASLRGAEAGGRLESVNLDGRLHPVGGAYLDVLLPARRGALHLAGLLSTYGREGAVPTATASSSAYLYSRQTILEIRIGGRLFRPLGHAGAQLVLGTGITLPLNFSQYAPTLGSGVGAIGPGGAGTLTGVSELPYPYPFSRLIPYLEAGVRHNRLTLLVDGRLGYEQNYSDEYGPRPPSGALSGYSYGLMPWYAGASLAFSLLRQQ